MYLKMDSMSIGNKIQIWGFMWSPTRPNGKLGVKNNTIFALKGAKRSLDPKQRGSLGPSS